MGRPVLAFNHGGSVELIKEIKWHTQSCIRY